MFCVVDDFSTEFIRAVRAGEIHKVNTQYQETVKITRY